MTVDKLILGGEIHQLINQRTGRIVVHPLDGFGMGTKVKRFSKRRTMVKDHRLANRRQAIPLCLRDQRRIYFAAGVGKIMNRHTARDFCLQNVRQSRVNRTHANKFGITACRGDQPGR